MSDYEILRETKVVYEYINDLLDNCDYISNEDTNTRNQLQQTMNILSDIYSNCYEMISSNKESYEQLKTNLDCPHCNNNVVISDLINYAYLCESCDENMYLGEGDLNHEWYIDKRNNRLNLNKSFVLNVEYDKETSNIFIADKENTSSEEEYNCTNMSELLTAIDTYVSNYEMEFYFIKIWETEEDRDRGESFEYLETYMNCDEAIQEARKILRREDYTFLEVYRSSDDELVFSSDGVEEKLHIELEKSNEL